HRLLSREGGDGSALGFFRDRYVVPGAALFLVLLILGSTVAVRRGGKAIRGVLLVGWFVLLAGVVVLTEWYFHGPRASELTGASRVVPEATVVLPLAEQMSHLGVEEALVIGSQSVDERPVWSPDGRYLAAKVDGKWVGVEPDSLRLKTGEWHDHRL